MIKFRINHPKIWKSAIKILSTTLILSLAIGCSNEKCKSLSIGGFTFGCSKQEAIETAKSMEYDIEPNGDYHLYLTGTIHALDILWNKMDICVDSVNGIKEIRLTRKYSSTTPELKSKVFNSIMEQFPSSEQKPYIESLTGLNINTGNTATVQSDYANLLDIIDEKDEYCGHSYYILSRDEFSIVIGKKHTKDILNN